MQGLEQMKIFLLHLMIGGNMIPQRIPGLQKQFSGHCKNYPTGFTINNLIYIGTGNGVNGVDLSDFYQFDPIADSWTQKANYPPAGGRTIVASFNIGNIGISAWEALVEGMLCLIMNFTNIYVCCYLYAVVFD